MPKTSCLPSKECSVANNGLIRTKDWQIWVCYLPTSSKMTSLETQQYGTGNYTFPLTSVMLVLRQTKQCTSLSLRQWYLVHKAVCLLFLFLFSSNQMSVMNTKFQQKIQCQFQRMTDYQLYKNQFEKEGTFLKCFLWKTLSSSRFSWENIMIFWCNCSTNYLGVCINWYSAKFIIWIDWQIWCFFWKENLHNLTMLNL